MTVSTIPFYFTLYDGDDVMMAMGWLIGLSGVVMWSPWQTYHTICLWNDVMAF